MKKFKSRLTVEEKIKITEMVQEIPDNWAEFYATKDNLRLYYKQNLELLFDSLKKGDKICYNENSIVLVAGFSDNNRRKYIKFLTKSITDLDKLLKSIIWNLNVDLWCKVKKNNPLLEILQANNFIFFASRGKELLLVKYINKEK